jgi:hypothetical protein
MFIATPDQISARDVQKLTMKIQAQNLLAKLDRRIQVAIAALFLNFKQNRNLCLNNYKMHPEIVIVLT